MMLPGGFGDFSSTLLKGRAESNRCNNASFLSAEYPLPKESTLRDSPSSDKNRKVHKMCGRYREIPDIKFRRELGFGPIVNWFNPAPILSAVMLPGWVWGFLVSIFRRRGGLADSMQSSSAGSEKTMSSSSRVKQLHKFKTKVARQFPFVKTPKNIFLES
jgi:hypothetical protein